MVEVIKDADLGVEVCPLCGTTITGRSVECPGCGVALEHPTTPQVAPHGF